MSLPFHCPFVCGFVCLCLCVRVCVCVHVYVEEQRSRVFLSWFPSSFLIQSLLVNLDLTRLVGQHAPGASCLHLRSAGLIDYPTTDPGFSGCWPPRLMSSGLHSRHFTSLRLF